MVTGFSTGLRVSSLMMRKTLSRGCPVASSGPQPVKFWYLSTFFRAEAERGGASDPVLLARQLVLVFDGASARAGIGADNLKGLVAPTVATLLDAAGVR